MAGMLRKSLSWLGLGADDDFDDEYDDYDEDDAYAEYDLDDRRDVVVDLTAPTPTVVPRSSAPRPSVVPTRTEAPAVRDDASEVSSVRVTSRRTPRCVLTVPVWRLLRSRSVRATWSVPFRRRRRLLHVRPSSRRRASTMPRKSAIAFRRQQPVIVNLQGLERDLARRLLDFSSGVAYGLSGTGGTGRIARLSADAGRRRDLPRGTSEAARQGSHRRLRFRTGRFR